MRTHSRNTVSHFLGSAKRDSERILRRLKAASETGQIRKARQLQAKYFKSEQAKLYAADRARKASRVRRQAVALDIAPEVNVYRPCSERASSTMKKKKSGGHRTVFEFGPRAMAGQLMVLDVLKATASAPEWQYCAQGKSKDHAVQDICALIQSGYTDFAVGDIADCYASFDMQEIVKNKLLPLSEGVIRHTIMAENPTTNPHETKNHKRLMGDGTIATIHPQPRNHGLPQGSVCSPYIAALLLKDIQSAILPDVKLVAFVDDLLVLSRDEGKAHETFNILRDELLVHPSGRLRLRHGVSGNLRETSFDFLGYKIGLEEDAPKIELTDSKEARFRYALMTAAKNDIRNKRKEPSELLATFRSRIQQYRSLTNVDEFTRNTLGLAVYFFMTNRGCVMHKDLRTSSTTRRRR